MPVSANFDYKTEETIRINIRDNSSDILYAVNGQGGFYALNVEGGTNASTNLPTLVRGRSMACAVNKDSDSVYYNT